MNDKQLFTGKCSHYFIIPLKTLSSPALGHLAKALMAVAQIFLIFRTLTQHEVIQSQLSGFWLYYYVRYMRFLYSGFRFVHAMMKMRSLEYSEDSNCGKQS